MGTGNDLLDRRRSFRLRRRKQQRVRKKEDVDDVIIRHSYVIVVSII